MDGGTYLIASQRLGLYEGIPSVMVLARATLSANLFTHMF